MTQHRPTTTPGLSGRDAEHLAAALASGDVTVSVDGTPLCLPEGAREAVLDLLSRLARGEATTVFSARPQSTGVRAEDGAAGESEAPGDDVLTTSQAAELAGISPTYLRNLTGRGVIPVEYRGSHRRIRRADVETWLGQQATAGHDDGASPGPAAGPEELLTTSQAAALAGISPTSLRNLTSQGTIPVQYRGTHRRIRAADVQSWLAGRKQPDGGGTSAQ